MLRQPKCSYCGAPAVVSLALHTSNAAGDMHYCQAHWAGFAELLALSFKLGKESRKRPQPAATEPVPLFRKDLDRG